MNALSASGYAPDTTHSPRSIGVPSASRIENPVSSPTVRIVRVGMKIDVSVESFVNVAISSSSLAQCVTTRITTISIPIPPIIRFPRAIRCDW